MHQIDTHSVATLSGQHSHRPWTRLNGAFEWNQHQQTGVRVPTDFKFTESASQDLVPKPGDPQEGHPVSPSGLQQHRGSGPQRPDASSRCGGPQESSTSPPQSTHHRYACRIWKTCTVGKHTRLGRKKISGIFNQTDKWWFKTTDVPEMKFGTGDSGRL